MAGIKITTKLTASSLIEVITAMVILMVVFSVAMMIFTQVTRSTVNLKKLKANSVLQSALVAAKESPPGADSSFVEEGILVEERIRPRRGTGSLFELEATAFNKDTHDSLASIKVILIK